MAEPLPPLKPIPIKDRLSVLFIEKGGLDVLDGAFVVVDKTGVRTHIPIGGVACLMRVPHACGDKPTAAVLAAALCLLGETPPGRIAVVISDDTHRRLFSTRRSGRAELAVRHDVEQKVLNASTPSGPVPWPAAVMGNGDDADHIGLQPVDQRIRKTVEMQRPRVTRAGMAQLGKPVQEAKRSIEFIDEIVRCNKRAFADEPIDSGIGIRLSLIAKTDPHRSWQH